MTGITRRQLGWLACGIAGGFSLPRIGASGEAPVDLVGTRALFDAARRAWRDAAPRPTPARGVDETGGAVWRYALTPPSSLRLRRRQDLWELTFDLPAGGLVLAGRGRRLARVAAHPAAPLGGSGYDTILWHDEAATLTSSAGPVQRARPPLRLAAARLPTDYARFAATLLDLSAG